MHAVVQSMDELDAAPISCLIQAARLFTVPPRFTASHWYSRHTLPVSSAPNSCAGRTALVDEGSVAEW